MRTAVIRDHLRKRPFDPVRILLSDGASYVVRHPEMADVSQRSLMIGLETAGADMPDRFVSCDPLHVTRVEPLDAA